MKNKIFRSLALVLCIAALTLTGCGARDEAATTAPTDEAVTAPETTVPETTVPETTAPESTALSLPDAFPMELVYSSGVGAWRCCVTLEKDGSFTGSYSDSDMGDTAEAYPKGTVYLCNFSGKFEIVDQPDEHSYSLKLTRLTTEKQPMEEWIENETHYVATPAAGIDGGEDFVLYAPDAPVEGLNEDFLSWWPGRFEEDKPETLSQWGLCNTNDFSGFFGEAAEPDNSTSGTTDINLADYHGFCCYNGSQIQYQLTFEDGKLGLDAWVLRGSDYEAYQAQVYEPVHYELDLTTAQWEDNVLIIHDAYRRAMTDNSDVFNKLELTFLPDSVRMDIDPNMKYAAGGKANNAQPGIYELKSENQG